MLKLKNIDCKMAACIYCMWNEIGGYIETFASAVLTVKRISAIWNRKNACGIRTVGLCSYVFCFAVCQIIVMTQTNVNQECLCAVP